MKTRKGIFYDLKESTYIYEIKNYKFYFSSLFYLDKYNKGLSEFIIYEKARLKQRYGVYIDMTTLLYLVYYLKVEKRGFYAKYKDKELDLSKTKFLFDMFER